ESRAAEGISRIDTVPRNRPAMYSRMEGGRLPVGLGPLRLARETMPLPFAITIDAPFGSKRTDGGYQPAGMNPRGVLDRGFETSTTAMSLLSALAISKVPPSGESARLFGVLPFGEIGCSALPIVSRAWPVRVSRTRTVLVSAHAT